MAPTMSLPLPPLTTASLENPAALLAEARAKVISVLFTDEAAATEEGSPVRRVYYDKNYIDGKRVLRYEGHLLNGKAHGQGTQFSNIGVKEYEGSFENDKRHGQGTLYHTIMDGGPMYVGGWSDGQRHGHGTSFDYNGTKRYEGDWAAGIRHGNGRTYREDGTLEHEGAWRDGLRCGRGTQYDTAGDVLFDGLWHDDQPLKASGELPAGWETVPSKSRPDQVSYRNVFTHERIAWIPLSPASTEKGQFTRPPRTNKSKRARDDAISSPVSKKKAKADLWFHTNGLVVLDENKKARVCSVCNAIIGDDPPSPNASKRGITRQRQAYYNAALGHMTKCKDGPFFGAKKAGVTYKRWAKVNA